jgi:gliding motility-associated-like protein
LLEQGKTSINQLEGIKFENTTASPATPNNVNNNLMYYFRGNGLQYGINSIASTDIKIYHNTITLDDTTSTLTANTRAFGWFGAISPGLEFKNNIVVVRRGGSGFKYCIYTNINDSGVVANYNDYYISSPMGTVNVGHMGAKDYATLAAWLATRKDTNSVSIDPVFYDLTTGDLTPTKIALENKGSYVGIPIDVFNTTRSTTQPDIGAIEYTICKPLSTPVLTVDSAGVNAIKFAWTAVTGTTGYRVSRDGGSTWIMPSSGAMGTTHTVVAMNPRDTASLMVKALGSRADCPEYISQLVKGQTLTDGIFIPNTFTPNGNGQNDVFKVYSNVMKAIHWMVFNQWGEKVFETTDLNGSWDGSYKGKPQPIGVYVYVVVGTLSDGTSVTQKGTFNLIR